MKTKNIIITSIILVIFISLTNIVNAQTKKPTKPKSQTTKSVDKTPTEQETKDWIIEKLNKYKKNSVTGAHLFDNIIWNYQRSMSNLKVYFTDCDFIIEFDSGFEEYNKEATSSHKKYIIPIFAIELKSSTSETCVEFETKTPLIKCETNGSFDIKLELGEINYSDHSVIVKKPVEFINWDIEANLFTRMQKAFEYLKKFCKEPDISKEKF